MIELVPVTKDHVEWLRVHRSNPALYRYFRQDAPITPEKQRKWWRELDQRKVKFFIVCDNKGNRVGYVGFNPFDQYAQRAEFGIFILPEYQDKGYGRIALLELLKLGFTQYSLRTIYSDVIDYAGENRFAFYAALGFEKYPDNMQTNRYRKTVKNEKGEDVKEWIPAIRFFLTKDTWEKRHVDKRACGVGPGAKESARAGVSKNGASAGVHSG